MLLGPGHVSTVIESACLFYTESAQNYLHTSLLVHGSHKQLTLQSSGPQLVVQGSVWVFFSRRHSHRTVESRDSRTKQTQ